MCGITGFLSPNYQRSDLEKMTTALKHRGPDAEGFFWNAQRQIGLGHRRLSIIDLSDAANQPFYSQDGRYVMVFNGEVYNFQDLKNDLQKEKKIEFKTNGDTEVIIEAFAHWGLEAVHRFNGMFAIALWDHKKEELLLIRDRIGIKPLYYYCDGVNFAFASELKALLKLPFQPEINMEALKDYLFLEYVPAPNSIIKGIKKLEKGHYLKVDPQTLSLEPQIYYSLGDQLGTKNKSIKKEEEYTEEFKSELEQSLKRRSISDVPIGAFLSGGTDSSLISATFQNLFDQPINTFTVGFEVPDFDESEYAKQVADHIASRHFFSRIKDSDSISMAEHIVDHYDEPFAAPSTLPSLMVCQRAKPFVTVALGGDGGDEIFMGYGHYNWMNRIQKIRQYGGGGLQKLAGFVLSNGNNWHKRAARVFNYTDPESMWLHIWSQEQYMFTQKEIGQLLDTNYQHETLLPSWSKINKMPISAEEKVSLFDLNHYLPDNLLYKMDIASMASGLEVRVPLLDHQLIESAINMPLEIKIKDGAQKYLMKKVLAKNIPEELVYRKKWGFPAPVGEWLKSELHFLIEKYLSPKVLKKQSLFNHKTTQKLVNDFKSGLQFHYKRVWALIVFQMWYEKYMDKNLCK